MTIRLSAYSRRNRREFAIGFISDHVNYGIMVATLYAIANNPDTSLRAFSCEQSFFTYLGGLTDLHVRDVVQTILPKG